jgi:hypothetical protein
VIIRPTSSYPKVTQFFYSVLCLIDIAIRHRAVSWKGTHFFKETIVPISSPDGGEGSHSETLAATYQTVGRQIAEDHILTRVNGEHMIYFLIS